MGDEPDQIRTRNAENPYSLWTAPRSMWKSPFNQHDIPSEIIERIQRAESTIKKDDEQIKPFRTPVTAETLMTQTEN